jgi:hypothetical protein
VEVEVVHSKGVTLEIRSLEDKTRSRSTEQQITSSITLTSILRQSVMTFDFSFLPADAALRDYLPGILPVEGISSTFLSHYDFLPDKSVSILNYSRHDFWDLVMRSVTLIMSLGGSKGMRIIHYVSGNKMEDLVLRTASIFVGLVPVTINWQADIKSQIDYKITSTDSKIIVFDKGTPDVSELRGKYPSIQFLDVADIHTSAPIDLQHLISYLSDANVVRVNDTRCIIFTSGTTGNPKGVELSYSNYRVNRETFESFLGFMDPSTMFVPVAVNPMHHTNSTSITDWALRRPNTHLHLLERYSTQYWTVISAISMNVSIQETLAVTNTEQAAVLLGAVSPALSSIPSSGGRKVIAPLVSRHIDFLESLVDSNSVGIPCDVLRECLSRAVLLIGSAPVGPFTIKRLMKYANRLPTGKS